MKISMRELAVALNPRCEPASIAAISVGCIATKRVLSTLGNIVGIPLGFVVGIGVGLVDVSLDIYRSVRR